LTADGRRDGTFVARLIADPRRLMLVLFVAGLAASITLSETMLVVLALWLLRERMQRRLAFAWPLAWPILGFAVWTLVSALLSDAPADSVRATRGVLVLATLWIVLHAVDGPARARWFATALFVAVTVVAALSVVQVATCGGDRLVHRAALPPVLDAFLGKCARAHGFFSIYMTLAGVLSLVLTLTLARLPQVARRAAFVAGWLVGALAFALTFVRGAWVGFAIGLGVLATMLRRQVVVLAGVLIIAAAVLAVPAVLRRAISIGDPADPTARDRVAMLSGGLTLLLAHPVTGVGPGGVKRLYGEYAPSYAVRRHTSHLHDTPLQIAVERGLVGLALWVWIFVAFFARAAAVCRRAAGEDRLLVAGSMAAIAAFLVGGLFEYNFGDTEVLLVALSLMALPLVIDRDLAGRPA
jgi:O-Antigen ligase